MEPKIVPILANPNAIFERNGRKVFPEGDGEWSTPEEAEMVKTAEEEAKAPFALRVQQVKSFSAFLSPAAKKILNARLLTNTINRIPQRDGGEQYVVCRFIGNVCPYNPGKGVEMRYVRAMADLFNHLVEDKTVTYGTLVGDLLQIPLAPAASDQAILDAVVKRRVGGEIGRGLMPVLPKFTPDRAMLLLYVFTELETAEFDKRVKNFSLEEGACGDGDWSPLFEGRI